MDLVGILLNCLPILLLIGVWIFFMSRMKKGANVSIDHAAAQLEEARQMNRTLERIAVALEARRDA